mgnify:CR=1 FL=1
MAPRTPRLLMSACLIGQCCRWDARTAQSCVTPLLHKMLTLGEVVVVCPECVGGLDVPRPASEIAPGSTAKSVLAGAGKVVNTEGADVTENFVRGAQVALAKCKQFGIRVAILKAKSPSCSNKSVYDGTFGGKLVDGMGVAAELLTQNGITVFNETEIDAALAFLDRIATA